MSEYLVVYINGDDDYDHYEITADSVEDVETKLTDIPQERIVFIYELPAKPSVTIAVRGGVAEIQEVSGDVDVRIVDYDNGSVVDTDQDTE
jgi:hypothetical protein